MRCNLCGDKIVGKPGSVYTSSKGGWCGSKRVTRTTYQCQDCNHAGEYQQHLYRLQLQAEMRASIEAERTLKQGELF